MRRLSATALALILAMPLGAAADEVEAAMENALAAYRDGDVAAAREELDYAVELLAEMKAEGLVEFLPAPLPGWTREETGAEGAGAAFAMFGGGTVAEATYTNGNAEFTLTLLANSPMVGGIAAMVSGMGGMAGKAVRIQRERFLDAEGELQGVVDDRVLVQASGSAPVDDMVAHIETMDLGALAEF